MCKSLEKAQVGVHLRKRGKFTLRKITQKRKKSSAKPPRAEDSSGERPVTYSLISS